MANLRIMQPSFAAGELTPALHARVDLAKYNVGAKQLKNFFVHAHGGASNRQGTYYVATALGITRLEPFQYNVEQAYILEFSDYVMRVLKDGGLVVLDDTVVEIETPYPASAISGLKFTQSADVMYITHPDYAPRRLTRSSHTAWAFETLLFSPSVPTPSVPTASYNGTGSYDIDYKIAAVSRLTGEESLPSPAVTVSADTSGSWEAGKYVEVSWGDSFFFSATGDWVSSPQTPSLTPYGRYYYDATVDEPAAVFHEGVALSRGTLATLDVGEWDYGDADTLGFDTVYVKLYESPIASLVPDAFNAEAIVFRYSTPSAENPDYYYKIYKNSRGYYGYIGTSEGTSFKDDNISPATDNGPQSSQDPFTGVGDYPGVAGIFQQRLLFGRTDSAPQTLWASQTGIFNNFGVSRPLRDTDSIVATLASTQVNEIRWLVPFDEMMVLTSGGEWLMTNGDNSDALTPTSVQYKVQGYRGCADVRPLIIGDTVIYVQRGGRVVRDLQYKLESDKYSGNNLSVLSEHIFRNKHIVSWAYQQTPNAIVWVVLDDGSFCSFTYLPEHEVWAWCPQETEGLVEDVASIPGDEEDEVYFVVKRNINGEDVRYIEKLHPRNFTAIEDAFFVDCGLTYDGGPTTIILGLDHLVGETVSILADGNVMPRQVVVMSEPIPDVSMGTGMITLPQAASKVHVGLPYTSILETLSVDLTTQGDTLQGKKKAISQVTLRLEDTRELWIGPDTSHLVHVPFRTDEGYDEATRLYTGDKRVTIRSSWGTDGRIVVQETDPLPVTILAIIPEVSPGG